MGETQAQDTTAVTWSPCAISRLLLSLFARCAQLKELNGMRGVKGQLHKKYPTVEAEWLVNFCWNHGALAYRSELAATRPDQQIAMRLDRSHPVLCLLRPSGQLPCAD